MSRIFSSYESSGGGVFVLRRAIAAGSLLSVGRDLTRTIVDRRTDRRDQDPGPAGRFGGMRRREQSTPRRPPDRCGVPGRRSAAAGGGPRARHPRRRLPVPRSHRDVPAPAAPAAFSLSA
ncbi:hypothetical protein GCM10010261_12460 [Streptomyces pilosus]|nr:hypothetical protein GCM10010261_12460 [Streptomyces pilosus]